MARHTGSMKVRTQYSGKLRDQERARRRARIENRKRDRRRVPAAAQAQS